MFKFHVNKDKNAIVCVLKGRLNEAEAREYCEQFMEAVVQLKPGYTTISDLREFVPPTQEVMNIFKELYAWGTARGGRGRSFRIVAETVGSQVGYLQVKRVGRSEGYEPEVVHSVEEVYEAMGWE